MATECPFPVSSQLRADHLCRRSVAQPLAMALGSEAQQVIADGSAKDVGRRASASQIERREVLHRGGSASNTAVGNTFLTTRNDAALIA